MKIIKFMTLQTNRNIDRIQKHLQYTCIIHALDSFYEKEEHVNKHDMTMQMLYSDQLIAGLFYLQLVSNGY
jgi:hypothetical protein